MKGMIKVTDEQPKEEIHKAKSSRVPSTGVSIPVELGYTTLPGCRCVYQPRSSPNLIFWGFYEGYIM